MKIRLQAVQWELGKGVTFDDFFLRLRKEVTKPDGTVREIEFKGRQRIIVPQKVDDFWLILMLTNRDHRRSFEMSTDDEGKIAIHPREVEEGRQPIDFNYFICHDQTGRGVYAHYHLSCGFDDLTKLSRRIYCEWKDDLISEAAKAAGGGERAQHKAAGQYAGWLKGTMLIAPKNIRALVEDLKTIRQLELSFGEVQVKKAWGRPLAGKVTVAKHTFTFSRNVPLRSLRDGVIRAIELSHIRKGKVVGALEDGIDRVYRLSKNAGTFEELDFDDVTSDLVIDPSNPSQSVVVKRMRAAIKERPGYFVLPEKQKKSKKEKAAKIPESTEAKGG